MVENNQGTIEPSLNAGLPPIDQWFHATVVWKKSSKAVFLLIDGRLVGNQATVPTYITFQDSFPSSYDIGLKRDIANTSLRGHLRDLMIFGRDLTGEELADMADPFGGVWIGLNDVTSEGTFSWPDGTHVTYTKWASSLSHNQNDNHDCVRMTVDRGAWDDTSCGKVLPFVCEKKI
ncbi:C-type lectin BPL-like [Orbicella faveolata]|uniref:C-type lectin BPL-like n=1 Tax=Orbicella faveolata TaxID=48498 RepID=UPI0009E611C5|nr:C-type lectin BPL-like [Orbicella faveolata]